MKNMRKDVETWLGETGLPWEIANGGQHLKVSLAGRFVGIIPQSGRDAGAHRARLNIRAQIRRAAREQQTA